MATVIVATAFGGPEVLSVVEQPVPKPQHGEVRMQVKAAGVNPIDYKLYGGMMGKDPDSVPLSIGQELSGVVTATGPEAIGPAGPIDIGDEVIAYRRNVPGAYASEVTWSADTAVPKPANIGWEQAAGLLLSGATAIHALTATDVGSGDTVLIHGGSGGTGLLAAQLATIRGARVIGTASEPRHEVLKRHGVEPVVYGPGLAERVRDRAPGGIDAAIDLAGTDEAIDVSLELVADKARITTVVPSRRGAEVGIKTLGSAPGADDPGTAVRAKAWSELITQAAGRELEVVVARTFPLTEAAAAHRLVASGHAGGKVILLP